MIRYLKWNRYKPRVLQTPTNWLDDLRKQFHVFRFHDCKEVYKFQDRRKISSYWKMVYSDTTRGFTKRMYCRRLHWRVPVELETSISQTDVPLLLSLNWMRVRWRLIVDRYCFGGLSLRELIYCVWFRVVRKI